MAGKMMYIIKSEFVFEAIRNGVPQDLRTRRFGSYENILTYFTVSAGATSCVAGAGASSSLV